MTQPTQKPTADSSHMKIRQMPHKSIGKKQGIPSPNTSVPEHDLTQNNCRLMSMSTVPDITQPILQAKRFCMAPTYSGRCRLTNQAPIFPKRDTWGPIKTLPVKSSQNTKTTQKASQTFCVKYVLSNVKKPIANMMPAAARTSRSFTTPYGAGRPLISRLGTILP